MRKLQLDRSVLDSLSSLRGSELRDVRTLANSPHSKKQLTLERMSESWLALGFSTALWLVVTVTDEDFCSADGEEELFLVTAEVRSLLPSRPAWPGGPDLDWIPTKADWVPQLPSEVLDIAVLSNEVLQGVWADVGLAFVLAHGDVLTVEASTLMPLELSFSLRKQGGLSRGRRTRSVCAPDLRIVKT